MKALGGIPVSPSLLIQIFLVGQFVTAGCTAQRFESGTISFDSQDGLTVTADLYVGQGRNAPFVLLCHRADWSRGEYLEIAPKLNEMGFNCMAIDQRSGGEINGVVNQTHLEAKKLKKPRFYIDALPDVESALSYVRDELGIDKVVIWGSSYSASLALVMGQRHADDIDGVIAFSPGEYFTVDNRKIEEYAQEITCPVFITSARDEHEKWKSIYEAIASGDKFYFLPEMSGKHGSEALWEGNEGHDEYWGALEPFLARFLHESEQ